jgi:hypothetical protein
MGQVGIVAAQAGCAMAAEGAGASHGAAPSPYRMLLALAMNDAGSAMPSQAFTQATIRSALAVCI